jgi:carboxylesterase type B
MDNTACGSLTAASARRAAGVKAWRYRYLGVFENTALSPSTGAFHNAEIPMIFGTTESKAGVPKDTPAQVKLVKNFMKAWAGFAKDPEGGLEKLGWPVWEAGSKFMTFLRDGNHASVFANQAFLAEPTLVRLGYNNQSEPDFAPSAPYDAGCSL